MCWGCSLPCDAAYAPPRTGRTKTLLAGTWKFSAGADPAGAQAEDFDDRSWPAVTVPHSWDAPGSLVRQRKAWYRTRFDLPKEAAKKRIFIYFEGVFQTADVYVNGQHLGQHRGVYVTPRNVSAASAGVSIRTMVTNAAAGNALLRVENLVTDASGKVILSLEKDVVVAGESTAPVTQEGIVAKPCLWGRSDPCLYTVYANVLVNGVAVDSVAEHTGLRSFKLTESDFLLNGASNKLRGVAKHQESEHHANAVTDQELIADWRNLGDLGVNFVRLAHYPHAELEYDLADRMGIMIWCENGQINFRRSSTNGERINEDMVYQNWNHPSIVFWGAGNEGSTGAASSYGATIRTADPSRPVVYTTPHLMNLPYILLAELCCYRHERRLDNIDYVFSNAYPGWYYGSMYDFPSAVESARWIGEAGAGGVITTQTPDYFDASYRVNRYEPEQYMQLDDEVQLQTVFITKPSAVPLFCLWVARDFGDLRYKGAINTKGLRTFSNYPKDVYYLYKSFLTSSPVLHVVGPHYFLRTGAGAIKVYSNAPKLTLSVNGRAAGTRINGQYSHPNGMVINNVFLWNSALRNGRNAITVRDERGNTDSAVVYLASGGRFPPEPGAVVSNLSSDNPRNPAYFIDIPVHDQWGYYCDFDSNGDNSFDTIPTRMAGASWIATKRQSDPAQASTVTFSLRDDADVHVMLTRQTKVPAWVGTQLHDTGLTGQWRDNNLHLVDYQLYGGRFPAGTTLRLGGSAIDFVILVRRIAGGGNGPRRVARSARNGRLLSAAARSKTP